MMGFGCSVSAVFRRLSLAHVLILAATRAAAEPACLGHRFERHENFGGNFDLFWTIDKARREISLCMQARTQGWVAFGLSQTGGMVGADIFRGYYEDGEPQFGDYWSTAFAQPQEDIEQDWDLIRAHRNETHTGFHGRRPLESCDDEDHAFTSLPNNIIWAFGRDDEFTQHGPEDRGGGTVSFFVKEQSGLDGELVIDLTGPAEATLPAEKTMYHCAFVPMPVELNKRLHITSYELLPDHSHHMHHENIYRCPPDTHLQFGVELNTFFDCKNAMPDDCSLSIAAATGMKKINGWSEAGIPVGGTDEDCADPNDFRCFRLALIEVHFENKHVPLSPIVNPVLGFRMYVTEHLRANDIGLMKVVVPQNKIDIPPAQKQFVVSGECGAECTAARVSEPVNLLLIAPHMHKIGFSYVLHHVRDGEAIGEYGNREYGWTDTITSVDVINARLLPGDRLVLECGYNSMERAQATHGGKQRTDEMCDAYIAVYPFNVGLSACLSMAPSMPDRQYCGPAERRFWEGTMSSEELESIAQGSGYPLLPYTAEPFTRYDDIEDKPVDLCAAAARYYVSDPQDLRAIVVGPAVVVLGYLLCAKLVGAVLGRTSARFREMSEANQRNVMAYSSDILVCAVVLAGVLAYAGWRRHPKAAVEWDGPISAVSGNVLIWSYLATIVFRSKVHWSTVCHHLGTIGIILLATIGGYHHGAEQYNKIGAVLLLMAVTDACGFVALIMHRFGMPSAATAFLASAVWNAVSKTGLFVVYWLVADIYPGRIRTFLAKPWSEAAMQAAFRTSVTILYLLQTYQTYVFYAMYKRLRCPKEQDAAGEPLGPSLATLSLPSLPDGNDEPTTCPPGAHRTCDAMEAGKARAHSRASTDEGPMEAGRPEAWPQPAVELSSGHGQVELPEQVALEMGHWSPPTAGL